jgi:hypothetical protein
MNRRAFLQLASSAVPLLAADVPKNPWQDDDLMKPEDLALGLRKADIPVSIICVAFPVLYRQRHIAGAVLAGPGSKPEGIEALKAALKNSDKDKLLVLYCGCCPMQQCPNIRPAYLVARDMGLVNVRVLNIPHNFHADWVARGYPVEPAA